VPKPDQALLDPARYPFRCEMQTRYGDLDTNHHLNNVALAGIIEDARVRFYVASGLLGTTAEPATMVVSLAIEYLGQAFYPQPLQVHVAALGFGRTSCALIQLITQDERAIALARTTFVSVHEGRAIEVPPAFVRSAQPYMLRP